MNFSWTKDQEDRYQAMLSAARASFGQRPPSGRDRFERSEWRRCGELGLLGLSVPQEHGGQGFDALETAHLVEAFGRGCLDMGIAFSAAAHLFACVMPIVEAGSAEQQHALLPGLCSGALIGANAITESEAGSDVFALKSRAVRDGHSYVINGHKNYVSNGPLADLFLVYAYTNPAHGFMGVSAFLIDRDTPGLRVSEPFVKMGLNSTPGGEITLEDCRVPAERRLGAEGQGAQIFQKSMQWERACLFASYLGMMDRQLEQALEFAKKRRQFGRAIGKHQAIAHTIADMKLRLESARLLLYRGCWLLAQGVDATMEIALAKLAVSEAAVQSSLDTIQIFGGRGYQVEGGVEGMLRDAIPSTLFSGTSEIQRDLVAKRLGL